MKKILFLIHDLGQGGAEKVLVNLVNNMDRTKFDISVTALFGGGVNEQFLKPDIRFRTVFSREIPANTKLMKLLSPKMLHRLCVKEHYDIEVSYLEGPSARIISGCEDSNTRLVAWIHQIHGSRKALARHFRSETEALACYSRFHKIICVSQKIYEDFVSLTGLGTKCTILYNTVESDRILSLARESVTDLPSGGGIRLITAGSLKPVKGFDRLLRVASRLRDDGYDFSLSILGKGPLEEELQKSIAELSLKKYVHLIGYRTNPYAYVAASHIYVCSSHSEGFSTAVTEALIVGTAVCTVEVSGMKEMLGENNEYGIVTANNEDALYEGLRILMADSAALDRYRAAAVQRGARFSTEQTVNMTEGMLLGL